MSVSPANNKSVRYDRQLRLWKEHGQLRLEHAKICSLGSSATATEILKNLILPGIGSFTVVDSVSITTGKDLQNNFFLSPTETPVGHQSRAKCVTALLKELNEEVDGYHLHEDVPKLIENNPKFFEQFSVVLVACDYRLPEDCLLKLSKICWENDKVLILCRSYGLNGYLRICLPEHAIVESHPENVFDLRLDCPWPELAQFESGMDLSRMDSLQLSHVPYVVILLKARRLWLEQHQGQPPNNSKERDDFKRLIMSLAGPKLDDPENFNEASSQAFRAFLNTSVPNSISSLFEDQCCLTLNNETGDFWFLLSALKLFVLHEGNGKLPLIGSLPDMKADTETYIRMKEIYQEKAFKDRQAFHEHLRTVLVQHGRSVESISDETVEIFCKNTPYLKLIRYRSLADEYLNPKSQIIQQTLSEEQGGSDGCMGWYVLFRAVEKFNEQHKRYPGAFDGDVENDIGLLKKTVIHMLNSWGCIGTCVSDDLIHEMVRAGAGELHSIAALMGGIASQECLKLITQQYVPLNNTFIFNGYTSTSATFNL